MKNAVVITLFMLVLVMGIYQYDPTFFGLSNMFHEGFSQEVQSPQTAGSIVTPSTEKKQGFQDKETFEQPDSEKEEGYADLNAYAGNAEFGSAEAPAGCYPRDQLTPSELLPKDMGSIWAEQNPMGPGSLKGKNFLSAGALIGVNTVGQSLRNANLQVRSEPPNPQVAVSIFNQSTISPDISHRPLEIGS